MTADDLSTDQLIRRAALHLFARRGFEATGIRDIANEVGLTPGALYHYIGNKQDLLVTIMREGVEDLISNAEAAIAAGGDPATRLAALARAHVIIHGRDQASALVGDNELRALTETDRRVIVQLRDTYEQFWRQTIEEGVATKQFFVSDASLVRLSLLQMCTGVAYWFSPGGRYALEKVADNLADLALIMVGARAAGEGATLVQLPDQRGTGESSR
jgi:AcrR family transcriptional regulator